MDVEQIRIGDAAETGRDTKALTGTINWSDGVVGPESGCFRESCAEMILGVG